MLGWHVSVYRQKDGGAAPATWESAEGARLAVWQADVDGLDWLIELAKVGNAINLGGNGYPCRFTATTAYLLPRIMNHPPQARASWLLEAGDLVTDEWKGKTVTDEAEAAECTPGEWLLVEVWDES